MADGCSLQYWRRRDPNQQAAPTSVSIPLGNVQSLPSTSVRRRTGLLSGTSTRRRAGLLSATADYRQDENANDLGAHTGGRRTADPREVGRNPEPDSFALNAVSQWRTEGERREIQRHFENREEHGATNEVRPQSYNINLLLIGLLTDWNGPAPCGVIWYPHQFWISFFARW